MAAKRSVPGGKQPRVPSTAARRGTAVIAIVLVLVMLQLFVVAALAGGSREQDLAGRRLDTTRAFFASEAGVNMAIREVLSSVDHDNDGGVGTVSDDGNSGNDPNLAGGRAVVSNIADGATAIITSTGRAGECRRRVEIRVE